MALYAVVHEIFEKAVGPAYPVVQHVFRGKTLAEARRYYAAHLKTDRFLAACQQQGRWDGVECWTQVREMRLR